MESAHSGPQENTAQDAQGSSDNQAECNVERFIRVTFEKLPAQTKVLIALFAALNSSTTLTRGFELPNELWNSMRFNECGPLVGETEEVNWLKGVCDGIILVSNYS